MCPDAATLSAYFDGELSPPMSREVAFHLKTCAVCGKTLKLFTAQRELLHSDVPLPPADGGALGRFWYYAGRSRLHGVRGVRRISLPVPLVAAAAAALVVLTVLNFIPIKRGAESPVILVEQGSYSPTVVSVALAPSDVDDFFALLEGRQGFNGDAIHTLPAELPVVWLGEPQIFRPANIGESP